ncbi:MAG: HAMP domain-containing protein [Chitinophagaceae bacterium]|nr:HAMP domain-containing protein [Chitinophagaceae bacterium]
MKLPVFKWYRNVSIAKKLYFTVGIMALLIAFELVVLIFSIHTLSSVRAYVNGEGLWSKAQKDGIYQLLKYTRTHDEADYIKFREFLKVNLGDHKTRMELSKPNPDLAVARQGFIEGKNHPDDIDGMIRLMQRFHNNYYIGRAITAWSQADNVISGFVEIGEQLHAEISGGNPSQQRINTLLEKIDPLNARLTPFEDEFSNALGEGSRWLENTVLRVLFIVALTVECTGLTLAITVSRGIQKGLKEILLSSRAVAKEDFSRKAKIFSKDEIGILASDFNKMAAELERLGRENQEVNSSLEKKVHQRTAQIESKNKELEQFAYVASHDLQEPLRTISAFVELLQQQYKGRLDENADKFMNYLLQASERMKTLIKDLLDYSRIGREKEPRQVDCNLLVQEVTADLDKIIEDTGATVHSSPLPVLQAYPTELKLLFQNLISNSIKFRKADQAPAIDIGSVRENGYWKFFVQDNGIGIESEFLERIFIIFQRLHTRSEYEGSGIGLAHCKKIVELHGGKIWAESTPGKGSRFFFTIGNENELT